MPINFDTDDYEWARAAVGRVLARAMRNVAEQLEERALALRRWPA